MIGRLLMWAIAATTSRVKALALALTPMIAVG